MLVCRYWILTLQFLCIYTVPSFAESPQSFPVELIAQRVTQIVTTPTHSFSFTPLPTQTLEETPTSVPTSTPTPTPTRKRERLIKTYNVDTSTGLKRPVSIYGSAFTSDGLRFTTGDWSRQILTWDTVTGKILSGVESKHIDAYQLKSSSEGREIWCGGHDQGHYRLTMWDIDTQTFRFDHAFVEEGNLSWDVYQDGSRFVYGPCCNGAVLYDVASQQEIRRYVNNTEERFNQRVVNVAISPDHSLLATIQSSDDYDGPYALIWDVQSGEIRQKIQIENRRMMSVYWYPDGQSLWIHSRNKESVDHSILDLVSIPSGIHLNELYFNRLLTSFSFGTPISMSPNHRHFATIDFEGKRVVIYDSFTGQEVISLDATASTVQFSPDGKTVLTGIDNLGLSQDADLILWDVSDLVQTPVPTLAPLPTYTPTFTPTAFVPVLNDPRYEVKPLLRHQEELRYEYPISGSGYALDPRNGDIVIASYRSGVENRVDVYKFPAPFSYSSEDIPYPPIYSRQAISSDAVTHVEVADDGTIAVMQGFRYLIVVKPDGSTTTRVFEDLPIYAILWVTEGSNIPDTKPGDLIFLGGVHGSGRYPDFHVFKLDMNDLSQDPIPLLGGFPTQLNVSDITIGPGGFLYSLLTGAGDRSPSQLADEGPIKILYWNQDGALQEWTHFSLDSADFTGFLWGPRLRYRPSEGAFYISTMWSPADRSGKILRVPHPDQGFQEVAASRQNPYLVMSLKSDKIYVSNWRDQTLKTDNITGDYLTYTYFSSLSELILKEPIIPTPTPLEPSPTPTPIKGWFVLDGFGGIHSTDPAITRPLLPYWSEFNIVRDIEPDPLGRGWYMLDGFGGIHTSSSEMSKPDSLPYFGFDIARNLEVKVKDGQYLFYLLDGFGVIHTTDPTFDIKNVMWFGSDAARDLEPGSQEGEWITMDIYGTLYWGASHHFDVLRFAHPSLISPIMSSCVRFPDSTTVLLDGYGGRHTNPYYPARNVVDGLPHGFYFPGWEIIQDMEVIPVNWK